MRLGLALGRSVREIRKLPYPEYKQWRLMYHLEPWGWYNEEINTARLLSMLHNTNVSKPKDAKSPNYFIRDMQKLLLDTVKEEELPDLDSMSEDEKRAWYIGQFNRTFGVK
jgi:hypothetical protein